MKYNDTIVIGAGFAGLIAAACASERGRKVTLLAKGTGALAIGSGTIDILGYAVDGTPLHNPMDTLDKLPTEHPYRKCQQDILQAVDFIRQMAGVEGYPLDGTADCNTWLPTAIGTLKPSGLFPRTLSPGRIYNADQVIILGLKNLKDHFPQLIKRALLKLPGYNKMYRIIEIDLGLGEGRDVTVMDIARYMDTREGQQKFIAEIKKYTEPGSTVLIPAILGTVPEYCLTDRLEKESGCNFIEMIGIPPGVTGYRLRKMLLKHLNKYNVNIVENASVVRAVTQNNRCLAVVTQNPDRERTYEADNFILATGGFLGGGLSVEADSITEVIYNLPVAMSRERQSWAHEELFAGQAQPFAKVGIAVNAALQPVDFNNQVIYENVYAAGRILAGYDYCFEKSGNGVALVTGYKAGMSV